MSKVCCGLVSPAAAYTRANGKYIATRPSAPRRKKRGGRPPRLNSDAGPPPDCGRSQSGSRRIPAAAALPNAGDDSEQKTFPAPGAYGTRLPVDAGSHGAFFI